MSEYIEELLGDDSVQKKSVLVGDFNMRGYNWAGDNVGQNYIRMQNMLENFGYCYNVL